MLSKNSFAHQQLQYIFRESAAYILIGDLDRFDDSLVTDLATVTNIRLREHSLVQVALPVCLRGLGLRMQKHKRTDEARITKYRIMSPL